MIMCYELGLFKHYGLNIPDLDLPFEYDFIEDLPTLKQRCELLGANGTNRYLYLGDEMGNWAPKDQAWLNVEFIYELQQVRKYGLSLIGCGIDRIDSRILHPSFFHGFLRKRSKTQQAKGTYTDWSNYPRIRRYPISDIPNIKVKGFDTYYKAKFKMKKQLGNIEIPLTPEHKIVKSYWQTGSWKGAGVRTQEGKRALMKVLAHHFNTCLLKEHKNNETPIIT